MNSRSQWESFIKHKEKRPKYGNKKAIVRGEVLDSKHEGKRYQDLLLMQSAGEISELKRQVEFACVVNGKYICSWFADFTYRDCGLNFILPDSNMVVEDAKSEATRKIPLYRVKRKLVEAIYNIEIKEV